MFGLTEWRQTRFYQETKLKAAPCFFKMDLSVEQIAEELEVVRKAIENQNSKESEFSFQFNHFFYGE